MKSTLLATSTVLAWFYGVGVMLVAFTETAADRILGQIYPAVLVVIVVSFIAYIVDALRNVAVPPEKRSLWAVVLALGHIFAQPFYWWWYLRPKSANSALHRT